MTRSAFNLTKPFEFDSLARIVAAHFCAPLDKVLVYDDAGEIDPPYEDTVGGRLWRDYEACEIAVYVRDTADIIGPFAAWFGVELRGAGATAFDDRPLAHAVARGLKQRVVFRDPIPDPHDNPIIEASQIAVDPDDTETPMWLVEYDDEGRTRIDMLLRSEI